MATPRFDLQALFRAIDAERERQGLTWPALARQVGVASSTIRRYREADDAEADGVLAMSRWLGAVPEDYVSDGSVAGSPLPAPGPGHVRVDMALVARAAGDPRGANSRTRTTIQRLVEAAEHAGEPIASLTRLAEV